MRYRVGSVPFLNAKPLVKPFEWQGSDSPVEVVYQVPSKLPALLLDGSAQAIMVSSIHALTTPGCRVAAGISIGSRAEVQSVRLFSKVPFEEISSLALDAGSMTSNALARIILAEQFSVEPKWSLVQPLIDAMLEAHDACVMIGDNGMAAEPQNLHVLDLGMAWSQLTGLPFVWALWVGDEGLPPDLPSHLSDALETSRSNWRRVIDESAEETGFSEEQCRHYLTEVMDYGLSEEHLAGLDRFAELAVGHRIIDEAQMPQIVHPRYAVAR